MSGSPYDPNDQGPIEDLFDSVFDLAGQVASRIGSEEIEVRLRRTLQEAAASNVRVLRPDRVVDPEEIDPGEAGQSGHAALPPPATLPHYRAIVALDIESSTTRPGPIRAELRNKAYELFEIALCTAGIGKRYRDPFVDRGDGILALIHPVDQAPKALVLNRTVPLLGRLLAEYNASLPRHSQVQRQLRIRVVVHAGDVHYDANGCFGEALDVAFRLLDATRVKKALRDSDDPLVLVVSEDIHNSVVRHGYDGIDHEAYQQLVRVRVAGKRYPGWIRSPSEQSRPLTAIDSARNRHLA